MKAIFRTLKKRWVEYFIEILVLIIGISLSLLFNDWRAENIDRKTERLILKSIQENLISDTLLLDQHLNNVDLLINGHKKMLSGNISTDSIAFYLDNFSSYSSFVGQDVGYEELKQNQSSRIIKNRTLLKNIITHYEQKQFSAKEWNYIDKKFVLEQVLPFMNKNMKYSDSQFLYNDYESTNRLLKDDDYFKNLVKSGHLFKDIVKQSYVYLDTETKDLIQEIETELKK